jgi:hypothetical protein
MSGSQDHYIATVEEITIEVGRRENQRNTKNAKITWLFIGSNTDYP